MPFLSEPRVQRIWPRDWVYWLRQLRRREVVLRLALALIFFAVLVLALLPAAGERGFESKDLIAILSTMLAIVFALYERSKKD